MEMMPLEDVVKIGSGGAGGLSILALFARIFRLDLRRVEAAQTETNKKLWKKCDEISQTLVDHRVEDAKTFISRDEFSVFRTHIDDQFEKTRAMLFDVIRRPQ